MFDMLPLPLAEAVWYRGDRSRLPDFDTDVVREPGVVETLPIDYAAQPLPTPILRGDYAG